MRGTFSPCLPTSGKTVPTTPDWLHEVKYDGYRLIVVRDGNRVRLITRSGSGCEWAGRFPWIVEAARKNRHRQLVIDGEAVLLAFTGISDFDGLHSGKYDTRKCSCAHSTSWRSTVRTCAGCRYRCANRRSHDRSRAVRAHPLCARIANLTKVHRS